MNQITFSLKLLVGLSIVLSLTIFIFAFQSHILARIVRLALEFSFFWCLLAGGFASRTWRPFLISYGGMGVVVCLLNGPFFEKLFVTRNFRDCNIMQGQLADFLVERLGKADLNRIGRQQQRFLYQDVTSSIESVQAFLLALGSGLATLWLRNRPRDEATHASS